MDRIRNTTIILKMRTGKIFFFSKEQIRIVWTYDVDGRRQKMLHTKMEVKCQEEGPEPGRKPKWENILK